jgi:hypothetical protein
MKKACALIFVLVPIIIFGNTFGVGVIIGSPTGFTGKYFMTHHAAFQVHAGWSFIGNVGFHVAGDYQFLFPGVVADDYGKPLDNIIPYIGIGARLRLKENEPSNETDFHVGMRMGGGIEYIIDRFGIFLEIYPVVDFVPETNFDFEGGVGFRFYFR